ncbi:MAG TPA: ribonuclease P protein component [Thermoanaerobaculia bacterium]|nr:ribonuclease P protein component [Thermoanaerobaculia bacterium]
MTAGGPAERDESLGRHHRVRRRPEYLRSYREGRRRGGNLATLFYVPNALDHSRLGVTASRKVGGAVVRQRLKRQVREIYRRWDRRGDLPAFDLVVNLKPTAATARFDELRRELERQLGDLLPGSRRHRSGGRSEGSRRADP